MKPWIANLFFCLLVMTLSEGCSRSHRNYPYGGATYNPAPIDVREAFSSATFTNGTRFLAMKLYITNIDGRAITLDKLECIFDTTSYYSVSPGRIVADFEMEFKGRKYVFPTPLEADGPSFGLFFFGEHLSAGETLVVEVYATITGCGAGESVILAEQAIGVRGYDHDLRYREVWLTCVQ